MTAMRDHDGTLRGYLKILRDLTERRQTEEALEKSESDLRRFIENVKDYALVQVDALGRISGWNTGAERIFGYTEPDILGQDISVLFTPEDRETNLPNRDMALALETGRSEVERWLVRQDGTRFIAFWVTTPIRDENGQLQSYAKALRDETERRMSEQRLRASLAERETLLKEIHHRVKNNLQVIISFSACNRIRSLIPQCRR